MLSETQKNEILEKAKDWFRNSVMESHLRNAKKLKKSSEFKINPFTTTYLANFLTGNASPESIAKALIYPRILGTSINTTFGSAIQNFTNDVLGAFSSTTSGIDIEYIDQEDGRRKYCQIKSGPNTINKDDVETLHQHFKAVKNLAKTNNKPLQVNDMVVGIVYGERKEISQHYKNLDTKHDYVVLVGKEFWAKLTGDEDFYDDLIAVINEVAGESDFCDELNSIINELAKDEQILELSSMANKESK
jgi:hypothetical protein